MSQNVAHPLDALPLPNQQNDTLAKLQSFVGTVRVMRENQRNYFKTRTRKSLQESMALEKKVDQLLADMAGG